MYDFKPPYLGAAYYPESWSRDEIDKDLDRLQAHGLNTVRVAEFAWSSLEPREGEYDMSLFREVVDKCKARGIAVVMCTPTACPPSWMAHKYPEIFVMDENGSRATHGHRRLTCSTSKLYRKFCADIVEVMAREFADDENIIGWQIDNEFIPNVLGAGCACPECIDGFRSFLRQRYGTVERLNQEWGHYTWSLDFSSFDEIGPYKKHMMPAVHKYMWAVHKSLLYSDFCAAQAKIIRKYTDKPIGTDMMCTQQLDIKETNTHLDVAQLNYYEGIDRMPFWLNVYGKTHNRPLWLTETSCCWNGANNPNGMRKKGFATANTLMPFAFGAEMCLYWLFRSHRGGNEMAHGSVVDAWGRDMHCSPEIRSISKRLETLAPIIRGAAPAQSDVAISFHHIPFLMDKYASFETAGAHYPYIDDIIDHVYMPVLREHFRPDVISAYDDLTSYKLLITHRHLTIDEGDFLDRIMAWVEAGGTWVVGPYTDILTRDLAKHENAPFGHLEAWADITRAFFVPAPNDSIPGVSDAPRPKLSFADGGVGKVEDQSGLGYDALIPDDGVKVLASYSDEEEYLSGYAAITETRVGNGRIILMGAQLDEDTYRGFIKKVATECGIAPVCEGSDNVVSNLLSGDGYTVFTAIESLGNDGYFIAPFDCVNVETKERYSEGQRVYMKSFECIFAQRYTTV